MPPKKRIILEDEPEPEPEPEPQPVEKPKGRPSGAKDKDKRPMTVKRMEALQKAQAVRRANLEKKNLEKAKASEPPPSKDTESIDSKVVRRQTKQPESVEENYEVVYAKKPKPKKKIVYVEEDDSEPEIEYKYISKPKKQAAPPAPVQPVQQELSPLELLMRHYGHF